MSMESIEEKLGRLTNCLHDIKGLGTSITIEQRGALRRLVSEALEELDDVKEFIIRSVDNQLSPRQVEVLESEEKEEEPEDLEMEWGSMFARSFNVSINLRIFWQKLDVGIVDHITLAIILSDLRKVQRELEGHVEAVLSGKISSTLTAGRQVTGSTSELDTNSGRSVKYRKNKTENLARKISSTVFGSEKKRKSSLMKNLSSSLLKLKI